MMQVKRYTGRSFAEALIQAKHELGTEAIIVESRKVKRGGLLGLFGKEFHEITVAADRPPVLADRPPVLADRPPVLADRPPVFADRPPVSADLWPAASAPVPASAPPFAQMAIFASLEREVASLRVAIGHMMKAPSSAAPAAFDAPNLHGFGRHMYEMLVERGVEPPVALDLAHLVGDEGEGGLERLRVELDRLIGPVAPVEVQPGQRKLVALVGPTGVGKTTTVAKLAAYFSLQRGLKVGLITADTYRIAAIEQLRIYAEILGLSLHAVDTPAQIGLALQETAGCDLVLVDTGGRNHRDGHRMRELRDHLAILRPDETHLVFSLTANPKDLFAALDQYLPLGVNRLTFTKLDEASAPGVLLNVRMRCSHPFGYLTNGQTVPDDLLPADRVDFADILMGG